MCRDGLVVEVGAAVLLELSLRPSKADGAHVERICEMTGVWIGSTAGVPAHPTASTVRHTASSSGDRRVPGSLLRPHPNNAAVPRYSLGDRK